MDKAILVQYCDLKAEYIDLQERIKKLEKQIGNMESGRLLVSDTVKGTRPDGTYGSIRITGFPMAEYDRRKELLECRREKLKGFELHLLELTNEVDDYISNLDDARMRRVLRYRFIDGLSWVQVACRMGGRHTADSCRMTVNNFLKDLK